MDRILKRFRPRAPSLPTAISLLALAVTGTAYAAAPTLFSIADHTTPANTANVSPAGALTVGGDVRLLEPKRPFSFPSISFADGNVTTQFGATKATVAFTGFRVANQLSTSTTLSIYGRGASFYTTYSGYVVSGGFSPATSGAPTKADAQTGLRNNLSRADVNQH